MWSGSWFELPHAMQFEYASPIGIPSPLTPCHSEPQAKNLPAAWNSRTSQRKTHLRSANDVERYT